MATYGSCIATNESFASLGMSWVNPIGPRRRGTWPIPSEYKILHPLPICFVLRFIQVQGLVGHSALRGMEGLSQIPFFWPTNHKAVCFQPLISGCPNGSGSVILLAFCIST